MSGTSGAYTVPRTYDSGTLADEFNLLPIAANTWSGVGLNITLPGAGVYRVEAEVRASVAGGGFVSARLFNTTDSVIIAQTNRLVNQLSGATANQGQNTTAPATARVAVDGPTVIRLEAMRGDQAGVQTGASIVSNPGGQTWLSYERIA
ncbi:hypothetical protein [Streptomyces fuscigenes]|uniref:hypothetical protein n=1 Tax=Streptomyces fuscigenes TaxID=1528880 RepID=UPI001F287B4A|nr:hypothetical protein [Streptomyces fuscigenes]MCF3960617.1 hypothetical protein [Streptomyces fuscigenes]